MTPDYALASYVGGGGAEQYRAIGLMMVEWFRLFADLKPDEKVLEVGCGIGRIAVPLTQYLKEGTYDGFDIVPHGIEWCQQKVTPRYPNFRFFVADVHNKYYHPEGRHAAAEYTFPFADGHFDFVYLTSVFTHMKPKDLERYAVEIGRVLKPGGRCFCTAYVITQEARVHLASRASVKAFAPCPDGYWTTAVDNPEAAIAYADDYLEAVLRRSGLETVRFIPGEWWKNESAQDILIARKTK
ncbi:MAG: class I SAM-dependent methyltransferase [Usitatibacter sp.]